MFFRNKTQETSKMTSSTVHETKKDFQFTECDYRCNRMDNLQRHIKTKHQENSTTTHSCDKCDFKSKYANNLRRHIREVHMES